MTRRKEPKLLDSFDGNADRNKQDKISLLPDELLAKILSHVTLRQAVITSVLSKKWMNLWTGIHCLTFDGPNIFGRELSYVTQRLKTRQFVSGADNLVCQLMHDRSLSISSFSVYYEMAGDYVSHIDHWVSFAVDHNVEKLNLFFRRQDSIDWSFPPHVACSEKLCSLRELRLGGVKIVPTFACFKNLKLVSLTSVYVTDEAFDNLLSNCLLLVDLFVCSARNLKCVKIPESMVQLRFLHLYLCPDLLKLEVNAANLVVFSYVGDRAKAKFSFNDISKLLLLRLGGLDEGFCQLMTKNLYLQTLALDLDLFLKDFDIDLMILPTLTNLKVLTLSVVRLSSGFAGVVNLLRATPSLIKFELHLKDPDFVTREIDDTLTKNFRHTNLRQIKLSGFSGGEGHIKLTCFLIKMAVSLEKFTIFPYHIRFYLNLCLFIEPDLEQLAAIRSCVDQISLKLPSTAKLEFIER